jgi:hypothetical protein
MVHLPLLMGSSRLGDEPRQDLDHDRLVFLGQGFPRVCFAEQKIEEVSIFFSQGCSPLWLGSCRPREFLERGG